MDKLKLDAAMRWLLDRLVAERIDFRLTPQADGQWSLDVYSVRDSERIRALTVQWQRTALPC